jgi:hypothetical protein
MKLSVDAAMDLALQHHNAGRFAEAEQVYRSILEQVPENPYALHNLGDIFNRVKRYDLAEGFLRRAVKAAPEDPMFHNTLGVVLLNKGDGEGAFYHCKKASELNPEFALPWVNLGICYADLIDLPASIAAFERGLQLDPDNPNGHDGLGLSLLMHGQLQKGWLEQEWRWRKANYEKRRFMEHPQWQGEDLRGKKILLMFEQGVGDMIQFCRYAPLLAARGAKVILEIVPDLQELMHSLDGVTQYIYAGQKPPPFDYVTPLMSAPLWYGTDLDTIPNKTPYLIPPPQRVAEWDAYFRTDPSVKIAIVWAGRPTHPNDHNRSTTLNTFAPLGEIPGITFYSLQMGPRSEQGFDPPAGMNVVNLGSRLDSFDTSSAVLSHMDLIISVDTSVIHVAGAIGKPVWAMLAMCPDWRWMLGRMDTPWYPTMRLFRCPGRRDWKGVMTQVKKHLIEALDKKRRGVKDWALFPVNPAPSSPSK